MSTIGTISLFSPSVLAVYAAGLAQGLTLVSVPALSSVLTRELGFTDAEYGAIFLPQVAPSPSLQRLVVEPWRDVWA